MSERIGMTRFAKYGYKVDTARVSKPENDTGRQRIRKEGSVGGRGRESGKRKRTQNKARREVTCSKGAVGERRGCTT